MSSVPLPPLPPPLPASRPVSLPPIAPIAPIAPPAPPPVVSRPPPGPSREDVLRAGRIEEAKREFAWRERRKRRLRNHAVAGMILFFVANSLLNLAIALEPGVILTNAIGAVLFGLPLGWIISHTGGGLYQGALIGTLVCAAIIYLTTLILGGSPSIAGALVVGLFIGGLPGALVGVHAELDR